MNRAQLIEILEQQFNEPRNWQPTAIVRHIKQKEIGLAMLIGESLGGAWQSGDLIIFWRDGDHTDINPDDEIELLENNILTR